MYKKFETTIVTIVLEEVYADGFIEAYEREALKKVLKKVGINRDVFQNIHKKVAIEAKKKSLEPKLDDQDGFLMRVCDRLTESTTSEIAQEIITLLAHEFQLDIPTKTQGVINENTDKIANPSSQDSLSVADSSKEQSPKINSFETSEREIVTPPVSTPDIPSKTTKKTRPQITQPKKSIGTKKKPSSDDEGNLKISSPNYGLACYLLGKGSLSWMLVFALIPVLLNLNVQELYTQHKYFSKSKTTTVQGTVLGSLYARSSLFDSDIVEVHYHYIKDGKNFTGHSYTFDRYKKEGLKVAILVNNKNPKLSQMRDGSYYEYDITIFVPILALIILLLTAIYGTINVSHTPYSDLKMIGQDLNSILSHFCIRRLSIVVFSILFCTFFSVGDVVFNTLMPFLKLVFILGLVILAVIGSLSAES